MVTHRLVAFRIDRKVVDKWRKITRHPGERITTLMLKDLKAHKISK